MRPCPLSVGPGDRVAVFAPASGPADAEAFEAGVQRIRSLGLTVEVHVPDSSFGYLSAPDSERTSTINRLFARPDLHALFCARGGYGSSRILPDLDFDALRQNPKLIVGYSDITLLQMAALAATGVPSLSAAMVAVDWPRLSDSDSRSILDILAGTANDGLYSPEGTTLTAIKAGEARGPLIGGNLTMVTRLLGTPYMPDLSGAILFLEDVGEAPYRIDGLLAQLRLAGVFDLLGGLVFGAFTDAEPSPGKPSLDLDEILAHYARYCRGPVATGLAYGHIPEKIPIPVGVEATLDADKSQATLKANEPVVYRR